MSKSQAEKALLLEMQEGPLGQCRLGSSYLGTQLAHTEEGLDKQLAAESSNVTLPLPAVLV